jgi:hypothetical protein
MGNWRKDEEEKVARPEKFNFEKMKEAAMHEDAAVRKQSFIEYFERFGEFPSYLFDNEDYIDERLRRTINDLLADPETPKDVRTGIDKLLQRLPMR